VSCALEGAGGGAALAKASAAAPAVEGAAVAVVFPVEGAARADGGVATAAAGAVVAATEEGTRASEGGVVEELVADSAESSGALSGAECVRVAIVGAKTTGIVFAWMPE
jgi:hypothetical protein